MIPRYFTSNYGLVIFSTNIKDMDLLRFIEQFPDEKSCRSHLREIREKQGVVCKKCSGQKQYWLKAKEQWQCADCSFRVVAMGKRDGLYGLKGEIEFDEGYFDIATKDSEKKKFKKTCKT